MLKQVLQRLFEQPQNLPAVYQPPTQEDIIARGTELILAYQRCPGLPRFRQGHAIAGLFMVHDEMEFYRVVESVISVCVSTGGVQQMQFYVWTRFEGFMRNTTAWRSLTQVAGSHGFRPVFERERDIQMIDGRDYWLGSIGLALGQSSSMSATFSQWG